MASDSKRQSILLAILGVAVLAWAWYGGMLPGADGGLDPANLPGIDAEGVARSLRSVNTVDTRLINVNKGDSDPDRDLFQYGVAKPPPPDPAVVEAQRKAAEEAVKRQEELARAQKGQQGQQIGQGPQGQNQPPADAVAQAALALPQAPPPPVVPAGPIRQPPPPINFRFMGVMGPPEKKVAVLVDGDNMLLARKGEVIQGKFRVLEIGVEWAELGYTDPELKDFRKRLNFGM